MVRQVLLERSLKVVRVAHAMGTDGHNMGRHLADFDNPPRAAREHADINIRTNARAPTRRNVIESPTGPQHVYKSLITFEFARSGEDDLRKVECATAQTKQESGTVLGWPSIPLYRCDRKHACNFARYSWT